MFQYVLASEWDSWKQRQLLYREEVFFGNNVSAFSGRGRLGQAQILGFAKLRVNPHPGTLF